MIINFQSLDVPELKNFPVEQIKKILSASLQAADPYERVKESISIRPDSIIISDISYILYPESKIILVSIGKASFSMAEAVVAQINERIDRGVCVCKHNPQRSLANDNIFVMTGSHPVPDQSSVDAGISIKKMVSGLTREDLVIFLVSGGGSALVCSPVQGIDLSMIQELTTGLLKSGASIHEMNAVRKHLDDFKGGGFLKMCSPARVAALVVSDVVGSPLDVIASGPAVPDTSTFNEAKSFLERYLELSTIPEAVMRHFTDGINGKTPETLKPNDPLSTRVQHIVIASNILSAFAALKIAKESGFNPNIITDQLTCEASQAGEYLVEKLAAIPHYQKKSLLIAGGETVVKVKGMGNGGRNLEVALGAVEKMAGMERSLMITLATDGEDGPTEAAGAFVTGETFVKAQSLGLDPRLFLENNDAYSFFEQVGGLIITGPTGTNVNDLNFVFRF